MNRSPAVTIIAIIVFLTLLMGVYVFIMGQVNQPVTPQQTGSTGQAATSQPALDPAPSGQPAKTEEASSWTGLYVDRIDNNFIEIKVGDEIKVFLLPEGSSEAGVELKKDDTISFEVYRDKDGRMAVSGIRKLLPE